MINEGLRRFSKKGKGFFPPNPPHWGYEKNGLNLRDDLGIGVDTRLSVREAFAELRGDVEVWPSSEVACANIYSKRLHELRSNVWSAFAAPFADGGVVVVFNEAHSRQRRRATLMEEFFHLRLSHPPSVIRISGGGDAKRTFQSAIEEEAFFSGAAALVPYKGLRALVDEGKTLAEIAAFFDVSQQLVEFRAKITKLYRRLRR